MLFGKKIEPIKTSFDNEKFEVAHPYILFVNGMVIHGTYSHGDEKSLYFNYFDENDKSHQIMITRSDELTVYPLQSVTEKNSETYNMYSAMRSMNDLDFSKLLELKTEPEKAEEPEEPVEEDEPDIRSLYILDTRAHAFNKYPLFVRDNGDLVINYEFMEKLLYDDNVLIRISFGIKGHHSCAVHTFKSKDVRIHVGATTLTGKILDEYRDVITCVEIRADDWKQLDWARVIIKDRKDVTNDSSDK